MASGHLVITRNRGPGAFLFCTIVLSNFWRFFFPLSSDNQKNFVQRDAHRWSHSRVRAHTGKRAASAVRCPFVFSFRGKRRSIPVVGRIGGGGVRRFAKSSEGVRGYCANSEVARRRDNRRRRHKTERAQRAQRGKACAISEATSSGKGPSISTLSGPSTPIGSRSRNRVRVAWLLGTLKTRARTQQMKTNNWQVLEGKGNSIRSTAILNDECLPCDCARRRWLPPEISSQLFDCHSSTRSCGNRITEQQIPFVFCFCFFVPPLCSVNC